MQILYNAKRATSTIVYTIVIVSNQCSDRPTQYTLLMMHSASLSPKVHSSDQMLGFVA